MLLEKFGLYIRAIYDKNARFKLKQKWRLCDDMDDKEYLELLYYQRMDKKLNLESPRTFNEKLQWLKLYNRKSEYTTMVDKYLVKKYVAKKFGEEYIIPTLGIWDKFEEIDFNKLPAQFVLKCTHDSSSIVICKDKRTFDIKEAEKKIKKNLKRNYFYAGREYPYKNVKPRIIAERYMEDSITKELIDYKFYCFDGNPKYCQVICNRTTNETIDFFDMEWIHQEFKGLALPYKPYSKESIRRPINFEKMKVFSRELSLGIPFVRIDFYEINGYCFFGEITFYPAAGFGSFYPEKWNETMGELINIDIKNTSCSENNL